MVAALLRTAVRLTLCRSQQVSRVSPVSAVIRLPSSCRILLNAGFSTPIVSMASGSKR